MIKNTSILLKHRNMTNRICLITLVLISCLNSSCESDDTDNPTEFEKSETALFNFKKQTNNSYKYTVV
jgi:hypothetical protein